MGSVVHGASWGYSLVGLLLRGLSGGCLGGCLKQYLDNNVFDDSGNIFGIILGGVMVPK